MHSLKTLACISEMEVVTCTQQTCLVVQASTRGLLLLTCMSCTQVPLEAILNYDSDSLHAIKALIVKQQRSITDRLPSAYSQADVTEGSDMCETAAHEDNVKPVTRSKMLHEEISSAAETVDHFACRDDFDSSADTEQEEGSQVTDMSESDW